MAEAYLKRLLRPEQEEGLGRWNLARLSLFADEVRAVPPRTTVVVDEIQRLP